IGARAGARYGTDHAVVEIAPLDIARVANGPSVGGTADGCRDQIAFVVSEAAVVDRVTIKNPRLPGDGPLNIEQAHVDRHALDKRRGRIERQLEYGGSLTSSAQRIILMVDAEIAHHLNGPGALLVRKELYRGNAVGSSKGTVDMRCHGEIPHSN